MYYREQTLGGSPQRPFVDPMLSTTLAQRRVPQYQRRPVRYFRAHTRSIADIVAGTQAVYAPRAVEQQEVIPDTRSRIVPELPMAEERRLVSTPAPRWHLPHLRIRMPGTRSAVLYGMAAVVFVTGLAVSLSGVRVNHQVAVQVKHAQQQTIASVTNTVVPTAAKPTPAVVASYAVSPNIPKYIDIPALSIHARVLSEGVSKSGQLQVPWNIYDTGWYNASSQPGQSGGMLIDGHSGIDGLHGVFYRLGSLVNGDRIIITRGDNQTFTYSVANVQIVPSNSVDMDSMMVSVDPSKPGLNLITCTGDQIPGTDQLNERIQVYAVQQ